MNINEMAGIALALWQVSLVALVKLCGLVPYEY